MAAYQGVEVNNIEEKALQRYNFFERCEAIAAKSK